MHVTAAGPYVRDIFARNAYGHGLHGHRFLPFPPAPSKFAFYEKAGITSWAKRRSDRRLCSGDNVPQANEQIT